MTRGLKLDDGKLQFHLQDEDADAEMTAVLTFGAVKYEPGNWEHVEKAVDRYYDAVRRHMRASRRGEVLDPETGLLALAGAACSIHFLLALELKKHPELVANFPERLAESIRRARVIRAERLAALEAKGITDLAIAVPSRWAWRVQNAKRRIVASGEAGSRDEAKAAADGAIKKKRLGWARVSLTGKFAGGFTAEAPEEVVEVEPKGRRRR